MDVSPTSFDAAKVLEELAETMRPLAAQNGNTIRVQAESEALRAKTDAQKLRQSVLNLLSNACKFTRDGEIEVTCGRRMLNRVPQLVITVRDTGIGMSAAELKVALEPFRRVDRPDVLEQPGTGLGLPLAKALTEANYAAFKIESEPRAGTAIEIAFPKARLAGR